MFARASRPLASSGTEAAAAAAAASQCAARHLPHFTSRLVRFSSAVSHQRASTPIATSHAAETATYLHAVSRQRICTILDDTSSRPSEYIPNTPIRVLRTVADVREWTTSVCKGITGRDLGLALVPTMGALHAGHTSLLHRAAQMGHDKIALSIYVNPAQFGVSEDLDSYPKTWDGDCAVLSELYPELVQKVESQGASEGLQMAIFAPTTAEMYPSGFPGQEPDSKGSFVTITPVGELLEGKTRPTFFRGVATVCMKLFNIVQPSRVFFGQKDVQQTVVIRKMVQDFRMPIDVAIVPTVREGSDGLALSSRNVYLGARRRAVAPVLVNALRAAEQAYFSGVTAAGELVPAALKVILDVMEQQIRLRPSEGVMFELDYISLADPDTMEEIEEVDPTKGAILSGAIKMLPLFETQQDEDLGLNNGPPVRLIDNIILPPRAELKSPLSS